MRRALAVLLFLPARAALADGAADARVTYYTDDHGLSVWTSAAAVEQRVARRAIVFAAAAVDVLTVQRDVTVIEEGGEQPTGHVHDIDAASAASVVIAGGDRLEKTRVEGQGGVRLGGDTARLEVRARVSSERDYTSLAARVTGTLELLERNLVLTAFLGGGHDTLEPTVEPPGEADRWPASHDRLVAGVTASQLLSPTLVLSGGAAVTHQSGALENPYRRSLVRTTLFPEALPERRTRATAFAALAWYLGGGAALHVRQGLYVDSWDVAAWIPEAALVVELGARGLATLRHTSYVQRAADFYAVRYEELMDVRSGDLRLGAIVAHNPGLELSWIVAGGDAGPSFALSVGYELGYTRYRDLDRTVFAHVASAGISGRY